MRKQKDGWMEEKKNDIDGSMDRFKERQNQGKTDHKKSITIISLNLKELFEYHRMRKTE